MQEIFIESIGKILKNRLRIEKELNLKIKNRGRLVFIEGKSEDEYLGLKILEAIDLGFKIDDALLLKDEKIMLQILHIKNLTKRTDLERIKGRIIGTFGKTITNLKKLTNCHLALHDNVVGIIGNTDDVDEAIIAVNSLIHGSKQGNVYARLEKEKKKKKLNPKYKMDINNEFNER